jgi:uncharacterized protein
LKIVLDTNVALSALLWRGKPYVLLEAIRQRNDVQLFSSPVLLSELADVLSRPSPNKQLAAIGKSPREVLADYIEIVKVVEPVVVPRVVFSDADDDHVIAAAVSAQATLIVSGDSDLLNLGYHQGIEILSAAMAIVQIGDELSGKT